ncbi:uncharacterized membrane protein YoaK (UPF0700 family) [Arthrobacter sp. GAS37]|uniref:YoaK family protein n=1 Tax=Arthrobacter sp. GAS37 TaxID=3156261 RepID=UPI003833A7CA
MNDLPARRQHRIHLGLMLALTFSTGIIDAIGYLGLDRIFTANMTGNVVILGMALAGAGNLPVLGPLIALAAFMAGAVTVGRVLLRGLPGWTRRATLTFGVIGMLVAWIAALSLTAGAPSGQMAQALTAVLAFAMGAQAAAARHIAVSDVTTVVVTSAITGLAADSPIGGAVVQPWKRRIAAVLLIVLGALTGALTLKVHFSLGLFIAAAILLTAAVLGRRSIRAHDASASMQKAKI